MYIPEWLQSVYAWGAVVHMIVFVGLAVKTNESIIKGFFIGLATVAFWFIYLPLVLSFHLNKKS